MHTTHTLDTVCSVHNVLSAATQHERRTRWVVGLTAAMMGVELIAGTLTQSLALLADGWHMATHAGALGLAAFAYWFARTRARTETFAFGTGKVSALAGYTNAIVLALIALLMMLEAVERLLQPVSVAFDEALPVAVLGLFVNLVSIKLLTPEEGHVHLAGSHDHNLHSAYMHVMADALTSLLAIVALLGGRYAGWVFLDPLMAMVGSVVILRWSMRLCRGSAAQLLDRLPSLQDSQAIRRTLEAFEDTRVVDLHVWELEPGRRACVVSLIASMPRRLDEYRTAILDTVPVEHLTVEIAGCPHHSTPC